MAPQQALEARCGHIQPRDPICCRPAAEQRQIVEAPGDRRMLGAEDVLANPQRAPVERLGLVVESLAPLDDGQAVERVGDVRVALAHRRPAQFEGFLEGSDGGVVVAGDAVRRTRGLEAVRQIESALRLETPQAQAVLEQLVGALVLAQALVDLAEDQRNARAQPRAAAELAAEAVGAVFEDGAA